MHNAFNKYFIILLNQMCSCLFLLGVNDYLCTARNKNTKVLVKANSQICFLRLNFKPNLKSEDLAGLPAPQSGKNHAGLVGS